MEIKHAFVNFIKFVLRSLALSLLISFVGYCYLTRKFPPDMTRLKNIYASYKQLTKLTHEIQASKKMKDSATAPAQTEYDEDKDLEQLDKHRRQIIDLLSQFNFGMPIVKKPASETVSAAKLSVPEPDEVILSVHSYNNLKLQIHELAQENSRLRLQIVEIQKQNPPTQVNQ